MFLCQDGVVLCTTLRGLDALGILEPSLGADRSLASLYPGLTKPGFGSLRVAIRCLASTGWLAEGPTLDPETTMLRWTEAGRLAMRQRERYRALGEFLAGFPAAEPEAWSQPWTRAQADAFAALAAPASDRWRLGGELPEELAELIGAHLDAGLIVPMMLWLHETDRLNEKGPALPEDELGEAMGRLLAALGWVEAARNTWTDIGLQARGFALKFGGAATYLPLLARLPELYRGELVLEDSSDSGEWHVNRELNIRISDEVHTRYFADSDAIFREVFDREPIEAQPRFIADMGCGEGGWLAHLHDLVSKQTRRGEVLDAHPLAVVGIDPDPIALERARQALSAAGASALLLAGDVTDPAALREVLAAHGLEIEDGLHIRAFVDHERAYLGGDGQIRAPAWSTGAYLDGRGCALAAEELERDLIAHLRRWARHVPQHGLVVLEAHCVAPRIVAGQLGSLTSVAFDAHQAYSHQYPVDHAAFLRCAAEAGLERVGHRERRYPSSRPFISISLNQFLVHEMKRPLPALGDAAPRHDSWRPDPGVDLEDGRALHEMLFEGGDIRFPAMWCSEPTGTVVSGALEAIEARLATAKKGDAIRVLDYGAGTGTATIELLKACRERGYEERLGRLGAALEVHMVDMPSSWFAQAHELLRDCAWTRFHSLRSSDGAFRPLMEVTGGLEMDAVMANMVFHLIPTRALEAAMGQLSSVLAPRGRLLWSSPDLGPPGRWAVLLHDPNRALRERWLALLQSGAVVAGPEGGDGHGGRLAEAVRAARAGLDDERMRAAQERAERRILPHPLAADVSGALAARFEGEVEQRSYEMLNEEIVRGLLVPSNQAEYLPEIADRALREQVIRELMLGEVLTKMQEGRAGTALGLNLHWTLGSFSKRA